MYQNYLILLLLMTSFAIKAQEMHSPYLVCDNNDDQVYYFMKGNEFPQIPDLDWSDEVALTTKEGYFNGTYRNNIFKLVSNTSLLFETEERINEDGSTSKIEVTRDLVLSLIENDEVTTMGCIGFFDAIDS